jgi:cytochrome c-type biogenesis protein CcmH/NrfF
MKHNRRSRVAVLVGVLCILAAFYLWSVPLGLLVTGACVLWLVSLAVRDAERGGEP